MRIDTTNMNTPPPVLSEGGSKAIAAKAATGDGGADAVGGFSPTSDLAKLIALVQLSPAVRAEMIQDVSERAAIGELLSRTAATDTAAAMLDGPG